MAGALTRPCRFTDSGTGAFRRIARAGCNTDSGRCVPLYVVKPKRRAEMTKLVAVALILVLPGLVAADINRLRPSPDLEQPDALPWNTRTHRPELTLVPSVSPAEASICMSDLAERNSNRIPCPCPASQVLSRCLSQPDCLNHANMPILLPHAPRADEQRTSEKELRLVRTQERRSTDQYNAD
jgi:hypothetical protein